MSQEKLQTMIMQNFGGLKRCIMGFVQVENYPVVAKFETQWLFVFYFPEILLVMLN